MKKDELTHIIREIVAEEIRKELPSAIAEVFSNFMGKKQPITEQPVQPIRQSPAPVQQKETTTSMRQSLRELFEGTQVISPQTANKGPRTFTKDPKLNEVLNSTRPFNSQERGGPMAAVASMGGMGMNISPDDSVMMVQPPASLTNPSVSQAQLMSDTHAPLSDMPANVSVLDMKGAVAEAAPAVAEALTRDYSKFMKLVDKKRGKIS